MAQYGDKTTIIKRILDNGGEASNKDKDNMPTVNEVEVEYYKLKKPELVELLNECTITGFIDKWKADIINKLPWLV